MLAEKATQLKIEAEKAIRIANFWNVQIERHGEARAEAFYKHLGLNHLEKKSVEWEGLTLSREPTDIEKLCVKSVASAQDAGKASVSAILLRARNDLITEALAGIKKLTPSTYHELVLAVPKGLHDELRAQLSAIFGKGRNLVFWELAHGKAAAVPNDGEDDDELNNLTDLTDARVANDVQARVTAAATRFALLGLSGTALWKAVEDEMRSGSTGYIDRASQGVANKVLNLGRSAEMADRKDEIDRYEYSAILDVNTCDPCAADDGETATSLDELTDTPNPDCAGFDSCRCFRVAIAA